VIVVDCAAVVDALTRVQGTDGLRVALASQELHAPTLFDYEVVSAVRGLTLGQHLSAAAAEQVLTDVDDLPVRRWPIGDHLRRRAFALRHNVPAYDAAYVVLAEALACPLLTRDARLAAAVGRLPGVDVGIDVL
jgi:predicted nucleic acid-binding protein